MSSNTAQISLPKLSVAYLNSNGIYGLWVLVLIFTANKITPSNHNPVTFLELMSACLDFRIEEINALG